MIASSILSAFAGTELSPEVATRLASDPVAGFTLFRADNVVNAAQVRALTDALQAAAQAGARPLLIAADQEGGQLIGMGDDTTAFAGAMALGAAADEDLAERVAFAMGRELRAMGVNLNYAPVCDLASNPGNPAMGIRSFGDDPVAVARLAAATVRGLRAAGVASTAKHFPGLGDVALDTHYELASVAHTREALHARELVAFRAAFEAGADAVMSGHFALPALTGDPALPATLSEVVLGDLLRGELGYGGLVITDALDMHAIGQGGAQIVDVICALRAGIDLLLATPRSRELELVESGVKQALLRGLVRQSALERSSERLHTLRQWLAGFDQPALDVVGCDEHQRLARELADRSVTLVRNDAGLLPLRVPADTRVCVVMPRPADLTPADTSSDVTPTLAAAIRRRLPRTEEVLIDAAVSGADIASVAQRASDCDLLMLGTIGASLQPAQAQLARRLLALERPTLTIALRTPWDLEAYEESTTHVCSYGILSPTMEATVAAIFGEIPFRGRLPVALGDLYLRGHGVVQ